MKITKEKYNSNSKYENNNKTKYKKKRKNKKIKKFLLVIAFIFVILFTFFIIRMNENGWTYGGLVATILGHNSKTAEKLGTVYILVTGESQNLTDSIMLCAYNPKTQQASMMSIPRDTYTGTNQKKATASDKINTLYQKGPEKLLKEVNELTGLNVKYYMNIDTKGLRELIDAVGGVYFDVPIDKKPYVIMVVGVNGVGKTTTIGKLAYQFKKAGKSVYLGAADTFRAAAVEQLVIWGERVGVPVIKQKMGSDPASVAYDTLSSAVSNGADVVIIDTAGRLHNKVGLMNELTKIKNVMKKVVPDAPNEVLLVLDGSTGQNAFEQAKQFTLATEVTAMAITKLDGTAKGGVVIGISDQFKIPVKYIGLGEGMEDLQVFRKKEFVDSLFGENA